MFEEPGSLKGPGITQRERRRERINRVTTNITDYELSLASDATSTSLPFPLGAGEGVDEEGGNENEGAEPEVGGGV